MEIYHTETQADYDALMVELEAEGYKWRGTVDKPTQWNGWKLTGKETGVRLNGDLITQGFIAEYKSIYEQTPITKYEAKEDEKMKFTKENVYKLIIEYRKDRNYTLNDLQDKILNLDDATEKVVVPKCFDEWYKEIEFEYQRPDNAKRFALWKLCQKGFGYSFERVDGEKIYHKSELGEWLNRNTFLAINAILHGYTIEPEKLYYIPLPDLETSDGLQQVLSKRENGENYFASRPNEKLKQRFTKEELAQVPVSYKPYAKPI